MSREVLFFPNRAYTQWGLAKIYLLDVTGRRGPIIINVALTRFWVPLWYLCLRDDFFGELGKPVINCTQLHPSLASPEGQVPGEENDFSIRGKVK